MSYILEALKKSDAERKRGEVPTITDAPSEGAQTTSTGSGINPKLLIAGGAAVLVAGGVGAWALLGGGPAEAPAIQQAEQQAALQPPQPIADAEAQAEPQTKAEPVADPEPAPPAPVEAQTPPIAEPVPEPTTPPEPVAEPAAIEPAREVTVLKAETAPPPKVESDAPTIPEPVAAPVTPSETKVEPKPAPRPAQAQPQSLPKVTPLGSAQAHVNRAWESIDKGLFAQAVADLDAATALEPAFADAWFARGWANEKNGNEAQAIEDYGRAIAAKPDHAFALFSRGFLNLYVGNPRDAVLDFVRTRGVATDRSLKLYSHLWLYLSRARSGQNAQARLKDDAGNDSLAKWPGPLVLHYMGAMDEAGVLRAIDDGPRDSLKERQATGYFFLGALALEHGNRGHAQTYFEKTLATGAVDFRQYDAAKRELDRLVR